MVCVNCYGLCRWVWFMSIGVVYVDGCGLCRWVCFVLMVMVCVDGCGLYYLILTCCLQAALNGSLRIRDVMVRVEVRRPSCELKISRGPLIFYSF